MKKKELQIKPEKKSVEAQPEKAQSTSSDLNYRITQTFVFSLTIVCFVTLVALSLISQFHPNPYNESLESMVDVCRNITTTGFGIATGLLTAK